MGEGAPHAMVEVASAAAPAGFHAIIEIAGAPKAAPSAAAPAQQSLQLEPTAVSSVSLPPPVSASPATILADLAVSTANLQQVETQGAAAIAVEAGEAGRPRRRRRPAIRPEAAPVGLMQVETPEPITSLAETTATSAPHPTRRRTRPQASENQEPLVQVETQAK